MTRFKYKAIDILDKTCYGFISAYDIDTCINKLSHYKKIIYITPISLIS